MKHSQTSTLQAVAGNGFLDRRLFLRGGLLFTGGFAFTSNGVSAAATSTPASLKVPPWSLAPGGDFKSYGQPSRRGWVRSPAWMCLPMAAQAGHRRSCKNPFYRNH